MTSTAQIVRITEALGMTDAELRRNVVHTLRTVGATVDMADTMAIPAAGPVIGDLVAVYAHQRVRIAKVWAVTPTKLSAVYVTPTEVERAAKVGGHVYPNNITAKIADCGLVRSAVLTTEAPAEVEPIMADETGPMEEADQPEPATDYCRCPIAETHTHTSECDAAWDAEVAAIEATNSAPARQPLTDITWADVEILTPQSETRGWEGQADLTHELAQLHRLDLGTARALVYAAANGMPITLTWETQLRGLGTEVKTTTVLVEYLRPTLPGRAAQVDEVRLAYCGFNHPIMLSRVITATTPEVITRYRKD